MKYFSSKSSGITVWQSSQHSCASSEPENNILIVHLATSRLRGDENGKTAVCCACSLGACMKLSVSCLISKCEIECCKSILRQPNTENTPKTCILQTKCLSVLWASRSPFSLPLMSCLPQRGSVDVCCAWTTLKVNSFPSGFSVQCCLLLSWAIFHQWRQLHYRSLGARTAVGSGSFSAFPLLERSRGVLPRESFAEQLGHCSNGTWSNPSICLVLSSRRAENLESWFEAYGKMRKVWSL